MRAAASRRRAAPAVTLKLVAADYGDSEANSSRKYWDAVVKAYEKKTPGVTVDVSVYSWNDVDRKVKELVAAGEAPDLAQIGTYADYASADRLYEVDDLLSIPVQAGFLPQLADAGKVRRVAYGMPFAASTRVLFYNKKLFAQAGIDGAPRSWSELASDAEALDEAGVETPYALPLGPEEAQAETMQWLLSGGAWPHRQRRHLPARLRRERADLHLAQGQAGRQGPHRAHRPRRTQPRRRVRGVRAR